MINPMEVSLALLADAANATENHKLNVLGIFGVINPPVLPYRHPSMTLVLKFEVDPVEANTEKTIEVVLVDPDGRELNRIAIQSRLPNPPAPGVPIELAMNLGLNGVQFTRPGPHAFVILVNGETKKRVPMVVTNPVPTSAQGDDDDDDRG